MKPPPFKYYAPTSLDEALDHLAEYGSDAKILAGGQSLIPTMNFRLAQPEVLIDLNGVEALNYIRPADAGGLTIGAMTRQRQVERDELIAEHSPLIFETMPYIAHPQIRNRGTFGGSIAHADPAAELPAVVTVLEAQLKLQSKTGSRLVPGDEFFTDLFETALEPDEVLTEIILPPLPARTGYAFEEVSRRHGDYALVGAVAAIRLDAQGNCDQAKLVYFSVGSGPVAADQATALLQGLPLTADAIAAAAETAGEHDLDPPADIHASAQFRRHLAKTLGKRVLAKAHDRARTSDE
ncbi:MAG: xanthine dehydrogenase family protein subunit M [Anaerolineae bacterium]|nr:xanthine dehydrogenase family protein subunit M [Anaerolineae bacterium]